MLTATQRHADALATLRKRREVYRYYLRVLGLTWGKDAHKDRCQLGQNAARAYETMRDARNAYRRALRAAKRAVAR